MNDTQATPEIDVAPHDPAMAAADPAMFAPMNWDENHILRAHLTSGWYKQSAVYPGLSEPWRETGALLDDLSGAAQACLQAGHGEPQAPQAGPEPETRDCDCPANHHPGPDVAPAEPEAGA